MWNQNFLVPLTLVLFLTIGAVTVQSLTIPQIIFILECYYNANTILTGIDLFNRLPDRMNKTFCNKLSKGLLLSCELAAGHTCNFKVASPEYCPLVILKVWLNSKSPLYDCQSCYWWSLMPQKTTVLHWIYNLSKPFVFCYSLCVLLFLKPFVFCYSHNDRRSDCSCSMFCTSLSPSFFLVLLCWYNNAAPLHWRIWTQHWTAQVPDLFIDHLLLLSTCAIAFFQLFLVIRTYI